jgi:hypothetical protein
MWLLRDDTGKHIHFSSIADYTIERFRPYIYVLLNGGKMLVYSKLAEYPDLESIRLLKERTDGVKTVLSVDYNEGVATDQVRLAARVATQTKKIAFYYLEGTKPSDSGVLRYIDTDGSWLSTDRTPAERNQARITLETPSVDLPYRDYLMTLDEYGVYTFVLTTRYLDGTTDVDVQLVYSRSKPPLVDFDVSTDFGLTVPRVICFDYNQRLWVGGDDLDFKEVLLHADLMLVDYSKKLLYLRERYDQVRIDTGFTSTSTTTTTSTTSTTATASTTSSTTSTTATASTTSSTTSTTATFPPGLWLEAFDNLHWQDDVGYTGGHFTWTGTQWEQLALLRSGRLSAIGVWYIGYQPTHVRITFTGPTTVDWVLESAGGVDTIGQATGYSSGSPVGLDWSGGNDLDRLEFNWTSTGLIIPPFTMEFYVPGATTSSSTTSTSTTSTTTTVSTSSSTTSSSTVSTTSSSTSTTTTVPPLGLALQEDEFPSEPWALFEPVNYWVAGPPASGIWTYYNEDIGPEWPAFEVNIVDGWLELTSDNGPLHSSCSTNMNVIDVFRQGYHYHPSFPIDLNPPYDVYTHLNVTLDDMPSGQGSHIALFHFRDEYVYAQTLFSRKKTDGKYYVSARHRDDGSVQTGDEVEVFTGNIWLRLSWDVGGNFKHYYALSEPTVELDWTELAVPGSPYISTSERGHVGFFALHCGVLPAFVAKFEYFRFWAP